MTTTNHFPSSMATRSSTALSTEASSTQQTEDQSLYQQVSQSRQPDVLVKRQFEQRNQTQKAKLANEFIESAGRSGISQLSATPEGQHALVVVYDHAGREGRALMHQVHEEQGNTAVDYTPSSSNNTAQISQRATMLYEAMNGGVFGAGTDEKKIYTALKDITPTEFKALQRTYQDHYNRDLVSDIKSDMEGNELLRAQYLMQGKTSKADAVGLREAMGTFNDDEDAILGILAGKSPQQIEQLRTAYQEEHGRSLDADLKNRLGGDDLAQAEAAMRGEQTQPDAGTTPQSGEQSRPLSDAEQLYDAMDGCGTNEATIHALLKGRTAKEIQAIRNDYQTRYGRNLDSDLRSELSGRDLFDTEMNLRGRATTLDEALARMNERYEYERGDGNAVGNFVMDALSDKGALLDRNNQRANGYYQQAMSDGRLDQGERARLGELLGYANDDVGTYQDAKDSAADGAGTVAATAAATAVVVGSGGTATPLVLLMAGGAGATARTVTTGLIEGQAYSIEDAFTDAGIGSIDGLATVTGMKAGTAAAQGLLRTTAASTLRREGVQVTERTLAHMSYETLANSSKARVAFGAVEGSVDGAVGGALGSGVTTAASDGTWDQGIASGFERVGTATALGGGFGALGGLTGGGIFSQKSTHLADKMIDNLPPANTGGRRAVDEYSFKDTGYTTVQIEQMRQALLDRADIGRIQKSMQGVGIKVDREMIEMVKRYNFDSHGIVMDYRNYEAWNRLAQGEGTISDAAYMVHEIAEIKALQRVQQETGFDFMGRDSVSSMTDRQKKLWENAFDEVFLPAHRQALEVEYDFIAKSVSEVTGGRVKISRYAAAAADGARPEGQRHLLVDGIPIKEHHNWPNWKSKAKQTVDIGTKAKQRLRHLTYNSNIKLEDLIEAVRKSRIN